MTVAGGRVMTKTVDVQEAQQCLAELLAEVADGVEVILTRDQTPLARIVSLAPSEKPLEAKAKPRTPDLHPGSIWTSDDFDEPLPDEFWTGTP
jgi:prevent-host-death family protein